MYGRKKGETPPLHSAGVATLRHSEMGGEYESDSEGEAEVKLTEVATEAGSAGVLDAHLKSLARVFIGTLTERNRVMVCNSELFSIADKDSISFTRKTMCVTFPICL